MVEVTAKEVGPRLVENEHQGLFATLHTMYMQTVHYL